MVLGGGGGGPDHWVASSLVHRIICCRLLMFIKKVLVLAHFRAPVSAPGDHGLMQVLDGVVVFFVGAN